MIARAKDRIRKIGREAARGFVLLEVLISLTILAVTVSSVLRSFSQSLSAVRRLEVETQAAFFGQQLLDEFELRHPEEGRDVGGFGDDYWQYHYEIELDYEYPDYDESNQHEEVGQFVPMKMLTIEIFYDNGANKEFRALKLETALMGFERYSKQFKTQYAQF